MLLLNDQCIELGHFPDGTLLLRQKCPDKELPAVITWNYENNEEMVALLFLVKHLRAHGIERISLSLPYLPNARQDRVKTEEDVFTLKYFAQFLNDLHFDKVTVLDPHSSVSEALIDHLEIIQPTAYLFEIQKRIGFDDLMAFYPDEGAMKRYSGMLSLPYAFGIKKRDWATGKILGLDVAGETTRIPESRILIVDDICSRGGTFLHSAKKLRELQAKEIYLFVSHCENTILDGELLESGLINRVFTTNSIFTQMHPMVEVIDLV